MNKRLDDRSAFTFIELLAVLGSVALLMALAVPLLGGNRANSDRVVCQSNLRQIGRACAMWADDHGDKYPYLVPSSEGGNNDHPLGNSLWFQFSFIRAELGTPRILVCPTDTEKRQATDWSTSTNGGFLHALYRNRACSYLLTLGVLQGPQGLLSCDRNIVPTTANSGCLSGPIWGGTPAFDYRSPALDWTENLHNKSGNIVLNDGSVIAAGQSELRTAVQKAVRPNGSFLCVLYPD